MDKRKNFEPWKVAIVYNLQEGTCFKCGRPLGKKFHRHHKNGNNTNNSLDNLELHCASCHGGEAYTTHIKQKKAVIGNIGALIEGLNEKTISGSAGQVELESIKLKLKLIEQCYPHDLEELPVEIRVKNYLVGSGILLKEYEKGFREGMLHASEAVASQLLKLMVANSESTKLIQLLSKKVKVKKK